jgi:L-lactate dehydrogenase (cytochrome)
MAGRAYLYGLGAGGERGVDRVLRWWADDMRRTMTLIGASSIAELNRDYLGARAPSGEEQ